MSNVISPNRRKIKKIYNYWYPLITGIVSAAIYLIFFKNYQLPDSTKDVFNLATTLCGIYATIIIITLTLLGVVEGKNIIKQLRFGNAYNQLVDYFTHSIWSTSITAIIGLIGVFFIDLKNTTDWYDFLFALWLLFLTMAILTCHRVVSLFSQILKTKD